MTAPGPANLPPVSRCPWCGVEAPSAELSCPRCGAPVGRSKRAASSGWTEMPPIRDMARLRVGSSTCQIEGTYVPVADFSLAHGDSVYFAQHVLLWKDPQVQVRRMSLRGTFTRMLAGLPIVMTEAQGPGHIAFSRDEPGEMIALPLQPGQSIDVREHLFLAATSRVDYSWFQTGIWFQTGSGKDTENHYPIGQFMDRFHAGASPGLLLLHASGNVFVRTLAEHQALLLKPAALVYKDPTVRMALHMEYPTGGISVSRRVTWLHLLGPGRVAVQSAYEHAEEGRGSLTAQSPPPSYWGWSQNPTAGAQSTRPAAPAGHVDPRHTHVAKMVAEALKTGELSPETMAQLVQAAEQHGLSAYDVRLVVQQVKLHGPAL